MDDSVGSRTMVEKLVNEKVNRCMTTLVEKASKKPDTFVNEKAAVLLTCSL